MIANRVFDAVDGEIVSYSKLSHINIRLNDGREVVAELGKVSRKIGCILGSLVGWQVKVKLREPPKKHRIVDLRLPSTRSNAESALLDQEKFDNP